MGKHQGVEQQGIGPHIAENHHIIRLQLLHRRGEFLSHQMGGQVGDLCKLVHRGMDSADLRSIPANREVVPPLYLHVMGQPGLPGKQHLVLFHIKLPSIGSIG